jgi:hypothetical protein
MSLSKNIEDLILQKCGWNESQTSSYGIMVHNICTNQNKPIVDIISRRDNNEINIEWVPANKKEEPLNFSYFPENKEVIINSQNISNEKEVLKFLDVIEATINNTRGNFLVVELPKSKLKIS